MPVGQPGLGNQSLALQLLEPGIKLPGAEGDWGCFSKNRPDCFSGFPELQNIRKAYFGG